MVLNLEWCVRSWGLCSAVNETPSPSDTYAQVSVEGAWAWGAYALR